MQQMYNTDIHTYIYFPQFHEQQDCGNWQRTHTLKYTLKMEARAICAYICGHAKTQILN